jgi:hypothetical protein
MRPKETTMIELRDDQLQVLDRETQPVSVIDPRTGQVYQLIKVDRAAPQPNGASDPCQRTIEEITVGEATYRLRQPLTLIFSSPVSGGRLDLIPHPDGEGTFALDITGYGATFDEAQANWVERFHARIQTLVAKRPWELTAEEAEETAAFERTIDLPTYRRDTPYPARQIGTVTRRRPIPDEIQWEDGQLEHVHLSQMPAEFAAFPAGQRFEAIVVRASGTGNLLRAVFVSPLPPLPESSPSQAEWEALPNTTDAPRVSWDELK